MIWKIFFGLLGFGSFLFILHGYGFERIGDNVMGLGWWIIPLALSSVPVLICYASAWMLTTPELPVSKFPQLVYFTAISLAWNNLSPFVKMLGEPMRVMLLETYLPRKTAIKSMVLFNIAHMFGTLIAFVTGATLILFLYPVPPAVRVGFLGLIALASAIFAALYFLPFLAKSRNRSSAGRRSILRKIRFWMQWSFSKIRIFSHQHPGRFWCAVSIEVLLRYVEGLTFYIAFLALGQRIPVLSAALLDVGRALLDNIFFFIPYQVGSREAGLLLIADGVMKLGGEAVVSAAILYRLVEILWMGLGYLFYLLWIKSSNSRKSSI